MNIISEEGIPLNELQRILSDIPDPIFIIGEKGEVTLANEAALNRSGKKNPVGTSLSDLIYLADETPGLRPAWFCKEWLDAHYMPFQWAGTRYTRVVLQKRKNVPGRMTLQIVRDLIDVLLNRLRSPLTGIQGYTELIHGSPDTHIGQEREKGMYAPGPGKDPDIADKKNMEGREGGREGRHGEDYHAAGRKESREGRHDDRRRKERNPHPTPWHVRVNEGVQQLFDILDDLEQFHQILTRPDGTQTSYRTSPADMIRRISLTLSQRDRQRIRYIPDRMDHYLNCHPDLLQTILLILIQNAVDNTAGSDTPILLTTPAPNAIRITNRGPAIPQAVLDRLYFPFVTTKSNKLGLGLTIAQILASQQHALLYLTQNSSKEGVSFTLQMPPEN